MSKVHPPKMNGPRRLYFLCYHSWFIPLFYLISLFFTSSLSAQLHLQLIPEPPSCYGGEDGQVRTQIDGGTPPFLYQWSNGKTTPHLEGVEAGHYSVSLTDSTGQIATAETTLINPDPLLVFITPIGPSCQQSTNGEILVEVWQGAAPYTFDWSDGATGAHRQALAAGPYQVVITDANGCQKTMQIALEALSQLNAAALGEPASCERMDDGLLTASAQYGQQPYTYVWSTGDPTQVVENVEPGNYTVTITDALGCIDTASAWVQTGFEVQVSGSALLCGPGPLSQLSVVAHGGTAPYSYHWNTGDVSPEMSNLSEGEYTVTITDAGGCKSVEKVEILQSDFSISIIPRDVLCHGDSTGSILVQASGGEPPYHFQWSTGDETDLVGDLPAGTYSVTVSDSSGCQLSETLELEQPDSLQADFEKIDVSCAGAADGTVKINPIGGKPPYSFLWSNNQILGELNNLVPGDYTVTVSDANLCEEELHISITEPDPLEMDVDLFLTACDGSLGGMTAHVSGGIRPYHYQWSNGDTTITTSTLEPGTYGVTVTDANNCTITLDDLVLDGEPAFEIDLEVQDIECSEENLGSITAWVDGGLAPYTYIWSNGETDSVIANLDVGDYDLTVTDAAGCVITGSASVSRSLPVSLMISTQNIACAGQENGIAKAEVNGGLSPYFYTWNTGATGSSIVNLGPGEYSLTVTDNAGCIAQDTIEIQSPDTLRIDPVQQDISCFGAQDGMASLIVMGGVPPYEYAWGNGSTDSMIQDLPVGIYGVIVRDANDCIATTSIVINEPPPLSLSLVIEQLPCEGNTSGVVRSQVDGGVSPYQYLWSNGDTTSHLLNVGSGIYELTVTDGSGCSIEASASLNATPGLSVSLEQSDVQCFGQNNGVLEAVVEGGLAPLRYEWSNGSTNDRIVNLAPATYSLTVTDDNGCFDTISALITEPPALEVIAMSQNISCAGAVDGQASILVSGGVAPYSFAWGTGDTTANIQGLPAGSYGVIVEDANGCIAVASVEILEPPALELAVIIQNEPCEGSLDGAIHSQVSGGSPPYQFLWSSGDTTTDLTGIGGGLYNLIVTDSMGCQITAEVELVERPGVELNIQKEDISCFGAEDGSAVAEITDGSAPFFFNWSTGETEASVQGLVEGDYGITVTDIAGCTDSLGFNISSPDSLVVLVAKQDVSCFAVQDGAVSLEIQGGIFPYDIAWSNDSVGTSLTNLAGGDLEVLVTDANSCTTLEKVSIVEPDSMAIQFDIGITPCGEGTDGQISVEVTGGTPEYQYRWNTGDAKSGISMVGEGQYVLTVTDQNDCRIIDSVFLLSNPQPTCTIDIVQEVTNGADGALAVQVDGGTAPYHIEWNTGDTTTVIDSLDFGEYAVTITDANACFSSCSDTLMGLATLGSFVWLDENRNGIQDPPESGFADVIITLLGVDSANFDFTVMTTTNVSGGYQFEVPPGRYVLEFALPEGFQLTLPNEGTDDELDSDIDPNTYRSDTLLLTPRALLLNIDAGCISECDPFTEPGLISASTNYLCGAGNDPGPILNIVSPTGGSGETEYLWMQSTVDGPIGGGYWQPIPDSNTPSYDPGPLYETTFFVRCSRREKCPTYVESNVIQIEVGTEAVARVDLPERICEGQEVDFLALGAGEHAQIRWSFGGSAAPTQAEGRQASVRFSSFGSFTGQLEVSENDCVATQVFPINVINNPILCNSPLLLRTEIVEEANRRVSLSWDWPETEDTLSYEIQFSIDGTQFRPMRRVEPQARPHGPELRFALETNAPKPGRNFFRIKEIDQEGRFRYSAVHQLLFSAGSTIAMLFPNPVQDELHLEFFETFGEAVQVELYDFAGNLVETKDLPPDHSFLHFQLADLGSGFFFVRIYFGEVPVKHLRFFKN